ncbi:hypothetical protein KJ365_11045 [Glaciecola sp. XM2]|uniref:hypothetical protein n=1 Tax=Glaciecola sp. XM2 TaxID=1914931 RepID=UPI001BDE0259|nr:hypothetical protein [Glaciecola sp. XM2]MBT1451414.1 hypothetical protein [Glaciecola sp. XM2]
MKTNNLMLIQSLLPSASFAALALVDFFWFGINAENDFLIYLGLILAFTLMTVSNSRNSDFNSEKNAYKYSYFIMVLVFGLLCCAYALSGVESATLGGLILFSGVNGIILCFELASEDFFTKRMRFFNYLKVCLVIMSLIFFVAGVFMIAIGQWDWPFVFPTII